MIINELITNAIKHAFSGTTSPELTISFENADNTYTLTVQDNGIGLSDGFGSTSTNTLGLLLVRALTRQLRERCSFTPMPQYAREQQSLFPLMEMKGIGFEICRRTGGVKNALTIDVVCENKKPINPSLQNTNNSGISVACVQTKICRLIVSLPETRFLPKHND